jgi:hypothetical protein
MALFGVDVSGEQAAQLRFPRGAPRECLCQHLRERCLRVHRARINRKAGRLGGKAALGLGQAEFVARQIHQIGRIRAVVNGEAGRKPDPLGKLAQQTGGDGMERARPGQRGRRKRRAAGSGSDDALNAPFHFGRGATRECHQQQTPRIDPVDDEVRHAMSERVGFARTGPGDDQERPVVRRTDAVLDGAPLLRVELGEISGHRRRESPAVGGQRTTFPLLFQHSDGVNQMFSRGD